MCYGIDADKTLSKPVPIRLTGCNLLPALDHATDYLRKRGDDGKEAG